jgi:hypothetical protein
MDFLAHDLFQMPVSVYCAGVVVTGCLENESAHGVRIRDAQFRIRGFYAPAGSRAEEIGATWEQPFAVIPWSAIDYIGAAEPE